MDVVNLRATNVPGHSIRHRAFLGELTPQDEIIGDFAFTLVRRGSEHVRLRSRNFATRFLRHRDFHLVLEPQDSPDLAANATWFRQPAAVLIDDGPGLVPVHD